MNLAQFNSYCGSLPATEKVIQWGGAHVWKVGGKIFALASRWGKAPSEGAIKIGFKASDMAFMMLTDQPDIEDLGGLLRESYRALRDAVSARA